MAIDAVITWVDGADEAHRKKRFAALSTLRDVTEDKDATRPTRFDSVGEINYCVASLLKFAPWLRKIYIVTDAQTPPILESLYSSAGVHRIEVVDHREIFAGYTEYLPTFNSLAIEAMLWRIPGLSEQFIYCNDDCFLLRPVPMDAFFQAGKPVLRGHWKTQKAYQWQTRLGFGLSITEGHRRFQENSARLVGFNKKFWHLPHVPFPLLKSLFSDYFIEHPDVLLNNIQYAFRHVNQAWSISLAYHLAIQNHQVMFDNRLSEISINPSHHTWRKMQSKWRRAMRRDNTVFACFQSLDAAKPKVQAQLMHWAQEVTLVNEE